MCLIDWPLSTGPVSKGRRALLAAGALAVLAPARAWTAPRTVDDCAGRRIALPGRVRRVYAAGPPASILLFALAPDFLLGWTSSFRPAERPFVPERYLELPTLGRLTGRGNTANVEVVAAAKPDLIFDYGTVSPALASLADRVQQQTGIPYVLVDGAFDRIPEAFHLLGEIIDMPSEALQWSRYSAGVLAEVRERVARVPAKKRPRTYYGRGPSGLRTGLAGSINTESLEWAGAINVAAELGRGGLVQVSIEQVLLWAPEVIVTTDPYFFANVWRDPSWQSVPALDRVALVHPGAVRNIGSPSGLSAELLRELYGVDIRLSTLHIDGNPGGSASRQLRRTAISARE